MDADDCTRLKEIHEICVRLDERTAGLAQLCKQRHEDVNRRVDDVVGKAKESGSKSGRLWGASLGTVAGAVGAFLSGLLFGK